MSCPPGCAKCRYNDRFNVIECLIPNYGYCFDLFGVIGKCNSQCQSCIAYNPNICVSCPAKFALFTGKCISCHDANCLNCDFNVQYCLSCSDGYTLVKGACVACASNCIKCDMAGPAKCDACEIGNVILSDLTCAECLDGCGICNPTDLSLCVKCPTVSYMNADGACVLCPLSCTSCTSETMCTKCSKGYTFFNGTCYENLPFPCFSSQNGVCMQCFAGYKLLKGVCTIDNACSSNGTCLYCPLSYHFNKTSRTCDKLTCSGDCQICSATTLECQKCKTGFFLNNKKCQACLPGCLSCTA
jgi:proprotein convertase subtilisin/kexin type 5